MTVRRGLVIVHDDRLIVERCCRCRMNFAMPQDFYDEAQADPALDFYCPQGHAQHYTTDELAAAKNTANEAKRKAREAEADAKYWRDYGNRMDRQRAAAKGQVTRLRNKFAAGRCPYCNESFPALEQHIHELHPAELVEQADV